MDVETVLKQIGGGKYASKAKILGWIGDKYSLDTQPLSDMSRGQLLGVARKLYAENKQVRSDFEDTEGNSDSDSGSDSESGYTSDDLEDKFSLMSFSGTLRAQNSSKLKAKTQVKSMDKGVDKSMDKDMTRGKKSQNMTKSKMGTGTARTTRAQARAAREMAHAQSQEFSASDSDVVIKTHSLRRFAAS